MCVYNMLVILSRYLDMYCVFCFSGCNMPVGTRVQRVVVYEKVEKYKF